VELTTALDNTIIKLDHLRYNAHILNIYTINTKGIKRKFYML